MELFTVNWVQESFNCIQNAPYGPPLYPYLEGMSLISSMRSPTLFLLNIAKVPSKDPPTWKESNSHDQGPLQTSPNWEESNEHH